MVRDMSKKQFDAECAKRGFARRGWLGYYALPCGVEVSILNVWPRRRRDQLAYLIRQNHLRSLRMAGTATS